VIVTVAVADAIKRFIGTLLSQLPDSDRAAQHRWCHRPDFFARSSRMEGRSTGVMPLPDRSQ
jgi:hypothetical protein